MYFSLPHGEALHRHRDRAFAWGYGHLLLFAAVAGVGAGLHVAGLYLEHHSGLDAMGTVLTTAVPLAVALVLIYALYSHLVHAFDRYHIGLLAVTGALIAASLVMAASGVDVAWSLLVLASAPVVSIVGYEIHGHRHLVEAMARDEAAHRS